MIIGGFDKLTLVDYPGELAVIVFTQGCNFRCHFCYNPMLVVSNTHDMSKSQINLPPKPSEDDFLGFLKNRVGKIDAVVVSGGEPTLHTDLPKFIKKIKTLGYLVKLDTNGTNPDMLKLLIDGKLIDYVAMDIKGPLQNYRNITNTDPDLIQIKKSIKILLEDKITYEFRTTVVPGLHKKEDFHDIGELIKGARVWYIQNFRNTANLVNNAFQKEIPFSENELTEIIKICNLYILNSKLR